jgi:flagellar biosynthetic protein FliQ
MTTAAVVDLVRAALMAGVWISAPVLAAGFAVSVLISLLQIVTSIQDPSFGAVLRLSAFFGIVFLGLPWMLSKLIAYSTALLGALGRYAQ